ncbi:MAG: GIY-YIG nuclease family protein, partial [Candidatus Korobacteraceae bacterium]
MSRMRKFWVYIIASKSGTLYVGVTNSLDRRVFEHKQKLIQGFTSKYGCDRL